MNEFTIDRNNAFNMHLILFQQYVAVMLERPCEPLTHPV